MNNQDANQTKEANKNAARGGNVVGATDIARGSQYAIVQQRELVSALVLELMQLAPRGPQAEAQSGSSQQTRSSGRLIHDLGRPRS